MRKISQKEVLERIREVHGDTYDLSQINYKNRRTKIGVICKEHGSWFTTTEQLFRGQGCFICGKKKAGKNKRILFNEFKKKANEIHKHRYKYFRTSYKGYFKKTDIECLDHGIYSQLPTAHLLQAQGCPDCGFIEQVNKRRMPLTEFIGKANFVHSNKYDYSKVSYKNNREKIKIICPQHGFFQQEPSNHLNGSGCPNCNTSKGEDLIKQILILYRIEFLQQKTFDQLKFRRKLKCDFYLPKYNSVIEFNGRQHYEPVGTFGGEKAYKETLERDELKRTYLEKENINLLEVHYLEENLEEVIMKFISQLPK